MTCSRLSNGSLSIWGGLITIPTSMYHTFGYCVIQSDKYHPACLPNQRKCIALDKYRFPRFICDRFFFEKILIFASVVFHVKVDLEFSTSHMWYHILIREKRRVNWMKKISKLLFLIMPTWCQTSARCLATNTARPQHYYAVSNTRLSLRYINWSLQTTFHLLVLK